MFGEWMPFRVARTGAEFAYSKAYRVCAITIVYFFGILAETYQDIKMPDSLHVIDSLKHVIASSNFHSSYDVWKDFVLPILFALLAAGIAYFTFYRGILNERIKEKRNKDEENIDRLFYLSSLINQSLSTISQQIVFMENVVSQIFHNPTGLPPHYFAASNDLKRLSESNLENFLLAYIKQDISKRGELAVDVQQIITAADFLSFSFDGYKTWAKEYSDLFRKEWEKYIDLYNDTRKMLIPMSEDMQRTNNQHYDMLFTFMTAHLNETVRNETNIAILQKDFFELLGNCCNEAISKSGKDEHLLKIIEKQHMARGILQFIIDNNMNYADQLKIRVGEMKNANARLKQFSRNLRDKFSDRINDS